MPNGRPIYAALDLGTNNCRLIVAEKSPTRHKRKVPQAHPYRVVDAFSRIVRLGEGLAGAGRLSNEAMERTIAALAICARKMHRRGVTSVDPRVAGIAAEIGVLSQRVQQLGATAVDLSLIHI